MTRTFAATLAFALTLCLATIACAQRTAPRGTDHMAAPVLVRIGGEDTRGLAPIRLQQADVEVDVAGRLARTTLTLVLHNPNARLLEGTLEFPLAEGQQVAGFALDIDGEMREAVPVPKETGRQVFEAIERRQVDPGLLEQVAGNHFRLRVYPVPANGARRVRLVIDETLIGGALRLPVQLLSGADAFALRVTASGVGAPRVAGTFDGLRFERRGAAWEATMRRDRLRARTPVSLQFPAANAAASYVARMPDGERYVLGEVPVGKAALRPRAIPKRVGVLWDASASARHRDRAREFALLDRYFRAMGNGTATLRVLRDVGEDGGTYTIHDGDWSALRASLEAAVLDGATDLADWTPRENIDEYLLFSDGLRNYGDSAVPRLGDRQRLYAITSASANDSVRLAKLAQQRNGRLIDAARPDTLFDIGLRIVGLVPHGVADLEVPARYIDDGVLRIAGRATQAGAFVDVELDDGAGRRKVRVSLPVDGPSQAQVASLWAGWRIHALSVDPERNAAQIARIGQAFGVVTTGTSLLVLEAAEDYVRYDIPAPASLQAVVAELRKSQSQEQARSRSEHLEAVAAEFANRIAWWEREFPKDAPPAPREEKQAAMLAERQAADASHRAAEAEPPVVFDEPSPQDAPAAAAAVPLAAPPPPPAQALESVEVAGSRILAADQTDAKGPSATIALQPWQPDSPYARRLREAAPADVYTLYLDERDDHADSSAFYLDVADVLLQKDRRAQALRVLSNLAEMQLENRHVLRVLGYRLLQAKDPARAVEIFRKVRTMADEEPQSHRDLGLALAAAGQHQEAIERLYEVVARPWDGRFEQVELVALNELNAIAATSRGKLDTVFVDRRLLRNLPLDLRAVLAWDSDNSDMDLWVTDPNGERCYYGNRNTYQGGQLSRDFTGGYGPEEFLLRNAKPGKYRVEANFFGERQQIVTGATTLTLTLSTGWGSPAQANQTVTLRLDDRKETVLVGEFEVR